MANTFDRLKTALADRYAIQEELGAGGMATVYLAEDLKHHRKVAVKLLRPELSAILGGERFLNEIKVTANLQHPNILPLYDSGEADSLLYYVMPYVEGDTLRDKLNREKQLGVEETVEIAKSVAAALDYAHQHDVIHRDIKPENILLQSGQALVADFGIALAVSQAGGTRLTETGLSLGTPHYMSPEQATGDRELDARSDVYSLGATVYEMLVGDPPHIGSSAQAIIAKILSEKPSPITQSRDLVPANVDAAVQKALAKSPADRFTSAAQFADAVTNPAFMLPTTRAGPVAAATVSVAWNRVSMSLAALAALMTVVALWALSRPEPPKAVLRYSMAFAEEEALLPQPHQGPRIALSPDGSRMVYAGSGEFGPHLWVRARDQLHATPLRGSQGAAWPFFFPDGERVGFFTFAPAMLKVASLNGGSPITLASVGSQRAGASVGPDGSVYVTGRNPAPQLVRVREGGSRPEPVTVIDTANGETVHGWPDALPNGKGVLFTVSYSGDLPQDIAVANLATGEHRVLVPGVYARYATSEHLVYLTAQGAIMAAPFDQDAQVLTAEPTVLVEGVGVTDLAMSATGTLMYATGGTASDPHELVWVTRDGTAESIDSGWTGNFTSLALSPDGTRLAVTIESDIWIKQLDRGPLTKITFDGGIRPEWTPNGQSVTFVSRGLQEKRADGSGPEELLLGLGYLIAEGFWSPDGLWLVYRTSASPTRDIYALRPGLDSIPEVSVATGFEEMFPALSRDGRWLAFQSNESGQNEVYVVPFPNTGDASWKVSENGGALVRWAHSGEELFYVNSSSQMVSVEVLPGGTFVKGEQRVLFSLAGLTMSDHVGYDVTPDGQRFVMIRQRRSAEQGELIVVENFFEELKAKVGN